ncbi:MAG: hypothetical protein ACLFUB_12970 [Cyclobacteriaceae bacterium]
MSLHKEKTGLVTGVFSSRQDAENAFESLIKRGYKADEITVLMSDDTRNKHFKDEHSDKNKETTKLGNKSMEGAGTGSAIGGTTGAIVGAIAAAGISVALPGLGIILAGPLAGALAGAGAGGLTGGLIGALVGAGIPKERAVRYENHIKQGDIVLGVTPHSHDDATAIQEDWKTYHGEEVYH